MAEEKGSAEKDLLKIIENPGDPSSKGKGESAKKPQRGSAKKKFALPAGDSFASIITKGKDAVKSFEFKKLLQFKFLNLFLFGAAFFLFISLFVTVMMESSSLRRANQFTENAVEQIKQVEMPPEEPEEEEIAEVPPSRSLFKLGPVALPEEEQEQIALSQVLENFKLVGIALEPDSDDSYAMVENTSSNVTYFLKRGERLSNMKVVEITDNTVVFDIGGKIAELR